VQQENVQAQPRQGREEATNLKLTASERRKTKNTAFEKPKENQYERKEKEQQTNLLEKGEAKQRRLVVGKTEQGFSEFGSSSISSNVH
jgi:hypothetical protein